jgi:hypothetical protein
MRVPETSGPSPIAPNATRLFDAAAARISVRSASAFCQESDAFGLCLGRVDHLGGEPLLAELGLPSGELGLGVDDLPLRLCLREGFGLPR